MTRLITASRILASGFFLGILLIGCRMEQAVEYATAVPATTTALPPTIDPPPASPSQVPTSAATAAATATGEAFTPTTSAVPTLAPTTTPHPLTGYTIAGMRARDYPGGEINITSLLEENESFRRYAIEYPSDGLKITGTMNIPLGDGPFPVVILLHGYFPRDVYWPGADTWQEADLLARRGYVTIAPDLRSWGGSDSGPSFFHMGLVADTINLISSLPSIPQADPARVALWGHSMGGGIATKVLVIDERPSAAVLYAPNSADDADMIGRWGPGCLPGQSEEAGDKCNPADIIPPDLSQELVNNYLQAANDPNFVQQAAPIYHLEEIKVPVQIHIGTADGAALEQTPPDWSINLYDALQAADKDAALFPYLDQGHFFQPTQWHELMQHSLEFYDLTLKFD